MIIILILLYTLEIYGDNRNIMKKYLNYGTITPAILIISSTFIIAIYAILVLLATQLDFSNRDIASQVSLNAADAGVQYYRWHLNQDPDDFTDGTGEPGPYVHEYLDQNGEKVGTYSLEIEPYPDNSGRVTVRSTGWSEQYPNIKRTISAVFGTNPLTAFAFLHNSNIWFGQEITINGPVYTNGGVRMDGTNTSYVQTTKATYTCGVETGCSEPTEKPGIWGNGGPKELWEFPIPSIDFDSIDVDFNDLKGEAQNSGLYLGPSNKQGYHIVFNSNGTFDVSIVNTAQAIKGYSYEFGCENIVQDIKNEQPLGTFNVADSRLIFVEDDVWVDGTVNGEVTIAAGRFPIDTDNADIVINDNLVYVDKSGDHRLGLISQKDVVIGLFIPEDFEINGGLLAQKGRVIRHHYKYFQCSQGNGTHAIKNEFIMHGSIISNLSSYWNFSQGPGAPASGFVKTEISYDPFLEATPPGYFPSTGGYRLLSWTEE